MRNRSAKASKLPAQFPIDGSVNSKSSAATKVSLPSTRVGHIGKNRKEEINSVRSLKMIVRLRFKSKTVKRLEYPMSPTRVAVNWRNKGVVNKILSFRSKIQRGGSKFRADLTPVGTDRTLPTAAVGEANRLRAKAGPAGFAADEVRAVPIVNHRNSGNTRRADDDPHGDAELRGELGG
jgi:hypothetical protein